MVTVAINKMKLEIMIHSVQIGGYNRRLDGLET